MMDQPIRKLRGDIIPVWCHEGDVLELHVRLKSGQLVTRRIDAHDGSTQTNTPSVGSDVPGGGAA